MGYIVENVEIPKGFTHEEYIKYLYDNAHTPEEIEKSKEIIFRLVYPIGMSVLGKWSNYIDEIEFGQSDIALAFIKTYNNYNPKTETSSFISYFIRTLQTELVHSKYGKYRKNDKSKELYNMFNGTLAYLDESIDEDTGPMSEIIPDNENYSEYDEAAFKNDIENAIKIIEKKYGKQKSYKIYEYYIDLVLTGKFTTQRKIADEIRTTRSYVGRVIERYNRYLKNLLEKGEM